MKATIRVFSWSIIVALGGFLFGFDTAVISGAERQIQEIFSLTPFWHGFTISSALIGTVIGALVAGRPVDKYGRRPILFMVAVLYLISAVGCAFAPNVTWLIIFRILGGLGVGASSVVAPMYISEISPARMRGRMTALFQFNVIFGILMAYVSNYLLRDAGVEPWRWMLGVETFPALAFFLLLFLIPESPRFLVKIGHENEACTILQRIEVGDVACEIQKIKSSLQQRGKREKLLQKCYSKPIILAFLVAMFNQLSGINAILYYAPRIFELTGLSSEDSLLQSVMIGATNAFFTMVGLLIIDKVGRRKLLMIGSTGMAACLALVARTYLVQDFSGYQLLVFLLAYIMFFAFSTGAVIWVLIAEVFPNSVRGQGQSLGSFTHWFFAAVITFLFPIVARYDTGAGYSFLFFAVMMIVQLVVVWRYFPETKGLTLEELGDKLSGENKPAGKQD